jgi:hypothetical protein
MILSDREVKAAVLRKLIWVTPCPPASDRRWSATTLDLTLDAEIRPWAALDDAGADVTIDPSSPQFNSNELIGHLTQARSCEGDGYVIQPNTFVLGGRPRGSSYPTPHGLALAWKARAASPASALAST